MRARLLSPGKLLPVAFLCAFLGPAYADQPLMTLSVESPHLSWQDDFVVTLTIYAAPETGLPDVTIDGLDQFELKGTGKNLLQVPRGRTQKWILTYSLTATQDGAFKLGPAAVTLNDRRYYSNTLFITVEPPPNKIQPPPPPPVSQSPPSQTKTPEPKPPQVKPPVVLSAAEIKEKVLVVMETEKNRPFRSEAVPVTLRLLTQLPIDNLNFKEDPDFPGFLKYDFPFTSKPKAERVKYKNGLYASYDLLKFLLFPLDEGNITIPPVTCEMKVRVPSGAFSAADLILDLTRTSNDISMQVRPVPDSAVVGVFTLKNEIVSDAPQSKIIRFVLEGTGQLSTFDFPEITGSAFSAHPLSTSTTAKIEGGNLRSRKIKEWEILPGERTTSIVLPGFTISEFDPDSRRVSRLKLPALPLRFTPPAPAARVAIPFPHFQDWKGSIGLSLAAVLGLLSLFRNYRRQPKKKSLHLGKIFGRRNPKLPISKNAAQQLYQAIATQISEHDGNGFSLIETVKRHLPREEWLQAERTFRKLERTAFSQSKTPSLTYGELRMACERLERQWLL